MKTIGWTEVGAKVYAQIWEQVTKENAKWLSTLTADQIPFDKKWFQMKGRELTTDTPDAPDEYRIAFVVHVLTCAIGAALLRRGWMIETGPGKPILLVKDGTRLNVRDSIAKLADCSLPVDEWNATCQSLSFCGVPLAAA